MIVNFLYRLKIWFRCRRILRRLAILLQNRYGCSRYYTEAQLLKTFEEENLDQDFLPYAVATFCEPEVKNGILNKLNSSKGFNEFRKTFITNWIVSDLGCGDFVDSITDSGDSSGGDGGSDN